MIISVEQYKCQDFQTHDNFILKSRHPYSSANLTVQSFALVTSIAKLSTSRNSYCDIRYVVLDIVFVIHNSFEYAFGNHLEHDEIA